MYCLHAILMHSEYEVTMKTAILVIIRAWSDFVGNIKTGPMSTTPRIGDIYFIPELLMS